MDDEYNKKFDEMKMYIPFLDEMIRRLESTSSGSGNPRLAQLSKIKALRDLLLDKKKRMKMENLLKCEQVLLNLYSKVEQRETLPGIEVSSKTEKSHNKLMEPEGFNNARRKLKVVAESHVVKETLPEIARADQSEVDCTLGSKEPALFQRRPNKTAIESQSLSEPLMHSSKRNYTRVLVSPEPRLSQWTYDDQNDTSKLYHRRSPTRSSSKSKKEKTKNKHISPKTRKSNVNITLKVPEDRLSSLNTEDIFDRIISCDNSDVDIETLKELRTQIIGELKHTGAKDDISDLILKSYRSKKKTKEKHKVLDVEEGELSDSESEAIESIYGGLVISNNLKSIDTNASSTNSNKLANSSEEAPKIQICLVVSNTDTHCPKQQVCDEVHHNEVSDPEGFTLLNSNKAQEEPETLIVTEIANKKITDKFDLVQDASCVKEDINIKLQSVEPTTLKDVEPVIPITENTPKLNENRDSTNSSPIKNQANFYKPLEDSEIKDGLNPTLLKNPEVQPSNSQAKIPFLSDDDKGPNENKSVISQIDILQALRNEILNETIDVPGPEVVTQTIIQPKSSKSSCLEDQGKKKKISLENYKLKSSKISETQLFINRDETPIKPSRGLTAKECERFNFPLVPIDSSDDEGDTPLDDVSDDLAPKSPDIDSSNNDYNKTPVIIPEDPIKELIDTSKSDVDMRKFKPEDGATRITTQAKPSSVYNDVQRLTDPRKRQELRPIETDPLNSPLINPGGTPRGFPNSYPNMTPNRVPILTSNMTPVPGMEVASSSLGSKTHVYAPLWGSSDCDKTRSRGKSLLPTPSRWDNPEQMVTSNIYDNLLQNKPAWEDHNTPRGISIRSCGDSRFTERRDDHRFSSRSEHPMTPNNPFGRSECPMTPVHHFGRSDVSPSTPIHPFGRTDMMPSTPSHPFGRPDVTPSHAYSNTEVMPTTPVHPFGRTEIMPMTPSHPFGRSEYMPSTPSHPFSRSDCPPTPNYQFGRADCPSTPNHPFGRSGKFQDKYKRNHENDDDQSRYGPSSYREYLSRKSDESRRDQSLYWKNDPSRSLDTRNIKDDNHMRPNEMFYRANSVSRDRERIGKFHSRDYQESRHTNRSSRETLSSSRTTSMCRTKDLNIDNTVSVESLDAGRSFMINTSVNSTFQELNLGVTTPFNFRRQRAASVGRSLVRDTSVGRSFNKDGSNGRFLIRDEGDVRNFCRERSVERRIAREASVGRTTNQEMSMFNTEYNRKRDTKFHTNRFNQLPIRAKSVGRDIGDSYKTKSLQEIKADLKTYRANNHVSHYDTIEQKHYNENPKPKNTVSNKTENDKKECSRDPRLRTGKAESKNRHHASSQEKYSPTKNNRDPRIKRDYDNQNRIRSKERYVDSRDRYFDSRNSRRYGINYTNDNIAKGNILGSGYGVKNYRIPKIKRPVEEEIIEKELKTQESPPKDVRVSQSGEISCTKESKEKITKSENNLSERKMQAIDSKPIRTRRNRRAVVYDSDSEDNSSELCSDLPIKSDNIDIESNDKCNKTGTEASPTKNKINKSNLDDENLDFSFEIPDEEMNFISANMPTDSVLNNITDLIADLDKDIDKSYKNDTVMENDAIDIVFDSLKNPEEEVVIHDSNSEKPIEQSHDRVSLTTEKIPNIKTPSNTCEPSKVDTTLCGGDSENRSPELNNYDNPEKINMEDSSKNAQPNLMTDIISKVCENTPVGLPPLDISLPSAEPSIKRDHGESIVSTTLVCNDNAALVTATNSLPEDSNEVSSTPDSTIDTEDSNPTVLVSTAPSTAQLEMNSQISSTNKPSQTKDTSEPSSSNEVIGQNNDPLSNILSILKDKSKIKELLNMIDDTDESEKIKKKLAKLSEIVSDDDEDKSPSEQKAIEGDDVSQDHTSISKPDESDTITLKKTDEVIDDRIAGDSHTEKNIADDSNETKDIGVQEKPVLQIKTKKPVKKRKQKGQNKKPVAEKQPKRITRSAKATKKKSNRELQNLQDDIRDMFISNDVLNATGIRMCRLAKLVDEKTSSTQAEEHKTSKEIKRLPKCDSDLETEKEPVVIVEKYQNIEAGVKLNYKNSGSKPNRKAAAKIKGIEKSFKPGPKSKTRPKDNLSQIDPYEFESDSVTESVTKLSENSSLYSDSGDESSDKSFGSTELLVEMKTKHRRKKSQWKCGVIKSKKNKKSLKKFEHSVSPTELNTEISEFKGDIQRTFEIPDFNCFTDKNYCFTKTSKVYNCRLCHFDGEDIVHHYKKDHPHYEIPLSRMCPQASKNLIKQSMTTNFKDFNKAVIKKYECGFCSQVFDDHRKSNLELFFWHVVSTHTGEYKQLCSECLNDKKCDFILDIPPPPKETKGLLMGYTCGKCYYTQVSLENLKNHVSLRHNDEETEVYTVSLSLMSQKTVEELKSHSIEKCSRTLRNLRSSNTNAGISEDKTSDEELARAAPSMQSRISFETENYMTSSNETITEIKTEINDNDNHLQQLPHSSAKESHENIVNESHFIASDVYTESHFKLNYTASGSKEYICCINGNHYKTSLLISLKKHIQTKHSKDKWDGYCCVCKVIVMPQGLHQFKECLSHLLENHMDDFPLLENQLSSTENQTTKEHDNNVGATKSYVNVRPLTELVESSQKTSPLPKIESVMSLMSGDRSLLLKPFKEPNKESDVNDQKTNDSSCTSHEEVEHETIQQMVLCSKFCVVRDSMKTAIKLSNIFKCSAKYCSYTTDFPAQALIHVTTHQKSGGKDASMCSYCSFDASDNAIDLVTHVFKDHGNCKYFCNECFYRAATNLQVEAHFKRAHQGIPVTVLQSQAIKGSSPSDSENDTQLLTQIQAVKHYICVHDKICTFRTLIGTLFMEHINKNHSTATSHACYECSACFDDPEALLRHLQVHGLKSYQCTWCVHGEDSEYDMLNHLSIKHPHKQPQAYLRCIVQSKREGSSAALNVCPVISISSEKFATVKPIEVSSGGVAENPIREAMRAMELEKLVTSSEQCMDEDDPTNRNDFGKIVTPQPVENLMQQQVAENSSLESAVQTSLPVLVSNPSSTTSKTGATKSTRSPKQEAETTQSKPAGQLDAVLPLEKIKTEPLDDTCPKPNCSSEIVYCLDSDDEDVSAVSLQSAPVIDITDENDEVVTNCVRVPWSDLYKCKKCEGIQKTGRGFQSHLTSCYPTSLVDCAYCRFKSDDHALILNHYLKHHAPVDKYICNICKHEELQPTSIRKHFLTVHKINKVIFRLQNKDGVSIIYIASPCVENPKRGRRKRSLGEPISTSPAKRRFGPEDINSLPINQIFDEPIQCSICEFSTKVRQNLTRHLQLHKQKETVPDITPLNPVPHLESNEMHFDKMLNLASSSITNKQNEKASKLETEPIIVMRIPVELAARYPKYVPERKRYACGAKDCLYISIDEAMFRRHWETLHTGTNQYHCVHCPPNQQVDTSKSLTATRIIAHLKMHDVKLFACSSCSYYHHQQNILEKHVNEKHNGNAQIKIVRETISSSQMAPTATPTTSVAPTMDLKPWQCGLCSFKSMLRPEVAEHCFKMHQSKFQFKCAFCLFKSSTFENVFNHQAKSHSEKKDVFYYYYREGSILNEPDGTPRWMKQRRETLPNTESIKTEKAAEPTNIAEQPISNVTKPVSPVPINLDIVKSEVMDPKPSQKTSESPSKDLGNFCEPSGLKFRCPLCKSHTEDSRETMQSHLFEELKYRKWGCTVCSYKAFHKKGLKEHAYYEHRQNIEPTELSSNKEIEEWVSKLLKHQEDAIALNKRNFEKLAVLTPEKIPPKTPPIIPPAEVTTEKNLSEAASIPDETLVAAFGLFGTSEGSSFQCPKCDFKTMEEHKMCDHLESELSKVRWCCQSCPENFPHYHQAQFHSKSVHTPPSRIKEASRDIQTRSAWVAAVIRTQKVMISQNAALLVADDMETGDSDNSLLVVRYEKPVPIPENRPAKRRKRPANSDDEDSGDEKLFIAEEPSKKSSVNTMNCPHCEWKASTKSALHIHILRHYDLKPYTCHYCAYSNHTKVLVINHQELKHPSEPPEVIKTEIPSHPPFIYDLKSRKRLPISKKLFKVCLICKQIVHVNNMYNHLHLNYTSQFVENEGSVIKCSLCGVLRLQLADIEEHYEQSHPTAKLTYSLNKIYMKITPGKNLIGQTSSRPDDFCINFTIKPCAEFSGHEVGKSSGKPNIVKFIKEPTKTVAKKSTTKLPRTLSVARKSTTPLPMLQMDIEDSEEDSEEEYSYYGTKPEPLEKYSEVKTLMPLFNTMMPLSVKQLCDSINIAPKVFVENVKKPE